MYAANYGSVQHTMGFPARPEGLHRGGVRRHRQPRRAMVGGVLLGLIESLGAGLHRHRDRRRPGQPLPDIFAFIVLILVLTLRPQGLLGERVADRA